MKFQFQMLLLSLFVISSNVSADENKPVKEVAPLGVGTYKDITNLKEVVTYRHFSDDFNTLKIEPVEKGIVLEYITTDKSLTIVLSTEKGVKVYIFKDGNIFWPSKFIEGELENACRIYMIRTVYLMPIKANPEKYKVDD